MDKKSGMEHEEQKQPKVIISDLRYSRNEEEIETAEPRPEQQDQPVAKEVPPAEVAAPPEVEPVNDEPDLSVIEPPEDSAADEPPAQAEAAGAEESAEMEQLRQIFGIGITQYVGSQIGILINFALIYMGRAPNPSTGLVSVDLDKAKLSIDLLEFIVNKLQGDLQEQERANISSLVADLKYSFMQAASEGSKPPSSPPDQD